MTTEEESSRVTLILRFRDLVVPKPGYTVEEHNKIVADGGYTWWGWWKKQSERIPVDLWATLAESVRREPVQIFLVDSGQRRLYSTTLHDIKFEPGDELVPSPEGGAKTPDYYQKISKPAPFATWFKIGEIKEANESDLNKFAYAQVPHDPHVVVTDDRILGKRVTDIAQLLTFGNVTYWAIQKAKGDAADAGPFYTRIPPEFAPDDIIYARQPFILHISDLHLSSGHHAFATGGGDDHNVSLASAIVLALGAQKPGLVVVTGDLTWTGTKDEFDLAHRCLDTLRSEFGLSNQHFVIIPGNHDVGWIRKAVDGKWSGEYVLAGSEAKANYKAFLERWYAHKWNDDAALGVGRRFFVNGGGTLDVLGLNTSSLQQVEGAFAGLGTIPTATYQRAAKRLGWSDTVRATGRRFIAVHHHVLPVVSREDPSGAATGFGIALDAGSQLALSAHFGVDLILHGHQHHPFAGYVNSMDMTDEVETSRGVHVLGSGSAGVKDEHLGPIRHRAFNLIELGSDSLIVTIYSTERGPNEFRRSKQIVTTSNGWQQRKLGSTT